MVLAVRLHHVHVHVHGPKVGYAGLAAAALAGWVGLPGPGEAALVTAGTLAGRGRLDLWAVLAVAWLGAMAGGIAGWLAGRRVGRALMTAPGLLLRQRRAALARGERFYERFGALAVFLTPSWMAGIHGMGWARFASANALAALLWVLLFGVGADLLGPSVLELAGDLGAVGTAAIVAVAAGAAAAAWRSRRRRHRRTR